MVADLVGSEADLLRPVDAHESVRHPGHVRLLLTNLMGYCIALIAIGKDLYFLAECRREEDRLTVLVGLVEETLHHRKEAHVGHTVCLVDDGIGHLVEIDLALVDEIEKASRAGDEHVYPALQRLALSAKAHTAIDGMYRTLPGLGQRFEFAADLFGEFSSGGEDKTGWFVRPSLLQTHNHRDTKCQRLSRSGRCTSEDVLPGERVGDGGGLDGKRRADALDV